MMARQSCTSLWRCSTPKATKMGGASGYISEHSAIGFQVPAFGTGATTVGPGRITKILSPTPGPERLGSGEPDCPAGTFAAGYTMDAWERWRVVCLAALSVEDIEDIYLFGTMITGLLLIGLGFALVYRDNRKTVTAVQKPHKAARHD
ncbi:hypothetical protein DPX16_9609 [Anabarilius grahami]|uniref:Uncharacterized protein n=1 Tax=Anabarilius grahami TaxID=495550 RepID=A0A3N0Y8D2_ANAGA|nr:hypothetical protein DPX16_9609 [Anabarilius grahami]